MAPESRGRKRRREAPGASQVQADASAPRKRRAATATQPEPEIIQSHKDIGASNTPAKRRRLDRNDIEAAEESGARSEPRKKTRDGPSHSVADINKKAPAASKKRGRLSRTYLMAHVDNSTVTTDSQPKRKRGRPSLALVAADKAQDQQGPLGDPKPINKRARPSLSKKNQAQPQVVSKTSRRPGSAANPTPDMINSSAAEGTRNSDSGVIGSSKYRPRKLQKSKDTTRDKELTTETDEDSDTRYKGPFFKGEYQYITERMVTVPRSKIATKWNPLDVKSIAAVHGILLNAQRPVLYHLRSGQHRQEHAASILTAVMNRIQRKLDRGFPFPAPTVGSNRTSNVTRGQIYRSGHAEDLDYERAVDAAQTLEGQLNPTLHSLALLKAELRKQEKALEDDYKILRTLESNARDEARSWKKSMRTTHILAPEIKAASSKVDNDANEERWQDLELLLSQRQADSLYQNLEDEDLLELSQQIGSHMESMQANLRQVDGVIPAMETTKAAIHEMLLKHLDPTQCDEVLIG